MARILLVDDQIVSQLVLAHLLSKAGHTTISAMSGQEALTKLRDQRMDLALIDVMMPEMDGIALLRHIRQSDQDCLRGLPVIMLTASGQDDLRIAAQALGVSGFLTKPVSSWQLLEALGKLSG